MIEIITNKGKCKVWISDEDADLRDIRWSVSKTGYAAHKGHGSLHRIILERVLGRKLVKPERADHKDRNRLNCQRDNMRLSTPSQSCANISQHTGNKSGYKGVYFEKRQRKWIANITHEKKHYHIGTFETAEEAAEAYNKKSRELFGEFAAPADSKTTRYDSTKVWKDPKLSGISLDKRTLRWSVDVRRDNVRKYLGSYATQEEAIAAREKALADDSMWERVTQSGEKNAFQIKTGHKGIYFVKARKKYKVMFLTPDQSVFVGHFDTLEQAIDAQKNYVPK